MNDVYTNESAEDAPEARPLRAARCPVCDHPAPQLWRYASKPDEPLQFAVMCSRDPDAEGGALGRDGLVRRGCLLYMPPDDFYRATRREAVAYWLRHEAALRAAWA